MKCLLALVSVAIAFSSMQSYAQQGPTWTNDTGVGAVTNVYTANQRPAVSSAVFNNSIWVAYTTNECPSGLNACGVAITSSPIPSTPASLGSLNFGSPNFVQIPVQLYAPQSTSTIVQSYNSPALAVSGGYLYLAWTDGTNTNYLTRSADGVNWSAPFQLAQGYTTTWAPALVADVNSGKLYAAFTDIDVDGNGNQYWTPLACSVYVNGNSVPSSYNTCTNYTSLSQENFNPALMTWPGVNYNVYLTYEWRGDQHCLSGWLLDPDAGTSNTYNASNNCSDQTAVVPSMAIYNSTAFIAFGGNNSQRQFNVRYGNSGGDPTTYYKETLPQNMVGGPNLLTVTAYGYSELINFYVWNGQLRYLMGQ